MTEALHVDGYSTAPAVNNTVKLTSLPSILREEAKRLDEEFDLDFIVQRLKDLPGEIRQQQDLVYERKQALETAKEALANLEAAMVLAISEEKNDAGKPKYPNETARRAELMERKATSQEWQDTAQLVSQLEYGLHEAQADLTKLENEYSSVKYLANLQSRRLLARTGVIG